MYMCVCVFKVIICIVQILIMESLTVNFMHDNYGLKHLLGLQKIINVCDHISCNSGLFYVSVLLLNKGSVSRHSI